MFSIIIPTLQKDNAILNLLLDELVECNEVGEVIIIDNSSKGLSVNSEKIRIIIPENNLYVNPAWNRGVQESRYEFIGILNDDVIFPQNIFKQVHTFLSENKIGLVGLDSVKRTDKSGFTEYPKNCEVQFSPIDFRNNSWGSAIFGRRECFCHIPEEIKIFYGDDYLFNKNSGFRNFKIIGVDIKHLHSNTSARKEFDKIKSNDKKLYNKINKSSINLQPDMQKKFDLYVSLGEACSCSGTLRSSGLQYYSYPIDWLYGSDFLTRIELLTNNFENWLNKEDLVKIGSRTSPEPCDIYKNKRTGIVFNHDFKINTPLNDTFPQVKEKYNRRIRRLLTQIEASESILFVYINTPNERKEITNKDLIKGYELLKERFLNVDIHILYIFNEGEVSYSCKKIHNITDKITRISFDYNAYNREIPYAVISDLLKMLFEEYKITNKFLTIKNRVQKFKFSIRKAFRKIFSITRINSQQKLMYVFGFRITFKRTKKYKLNNN